MTNSFKDMVPDYYTRKQTLTNAERYITPRLKELEDMILGAEDKLYVTLEYDEFVKVRSEVAAQVEQFREPQRLLPVWTPICLWRSLRPEISLYARKSILRVLLILKTVVTR